MWLWVGDGSLCGCELVERGVAVGGWWVVVWLWVGGGSWCGCGWLMGHGVANDAWYCLCTTMRFRASVTSLLLFFVCFLQ